MKEFLKLCWQVIKEYKLSIYQKLAFLFLFEVSLMVLTFITCLWLTQ